MKRINLKAAVVALIAGLLITGPVYGLHGDPDNFKTEKEISIFKTPEDRALFYENYDRVLSLWPVQYETLVVETRFGRTNIIASGKKDAPPLILLHAASSGATLWFPNIESLSGSFRTYAVDIIGDAGKSVLTKRLRKKSDYALWLGDVFNALEIDKADVVGLSYGGWVTLNLALYAPDRVNRIVLLSPANAFVPFSRKYVLHIVPSILFPMQPYIANSIRPLFSQQPQETYLRQLYTSAQFCKARMVFPTTFKDSEIRQIKAQVLLVIGEDEVVIPDVDAAVMRSSDLMPSVETAVVKEAGHILTMDQPEAVNTLILDFLK